MLKFFSYSLCPFPFFVGLFSLFMLCGAVCGFYLGFCFPFYIPFLFLFICCFLWFRTLCLEGSIGVLSRFIKTCFRGGIVLFIASEVIFFFRFFWGFYLLLGESFFFVSYYGVCLWGVFCWLRAPLCNTVLLLFSGFFVSWCHSSLLTGLYRCRPVGALFIGCLFGWLFTFVQLIEYIDSSFSIQDNLFGRFFFIGTGFHGLHVLIGSVFLFVMYRRILDGLFSQSSLTGLELSIWYWHFVDVVWLFLFCYFYFYSCCIFFCTLNLIIVVY